MKEMVPQVEKEKYSDFSLLSHSNVLPVPARSQFVQKLGDLSLPVSGYL